MDRIKLQASDNATVEVDIALAKYSALIKRKLEAEPRMPNEPIQLPQISSKMLTLFIRWCKVQEKKMEYMKSGQTFEPSEEFLKMVGITSLGGVGITGNYTQNDWERRLLDVDMDTLFKFVLAANYLEAEPLLLLISSKISWLTKDMNVQQLESFYLDWIESSGGDIRGNAFSRIWLHLCWYLIYLQLYEWNVLIHWLTSWILLAFFENSFFA